nr:hypothetical protein HmN_000869100 [Hymenolepis microstoma]
MEINVQHPIYPSARLLRFPGNIPKRSTSADDFCQNQNNSPLQLSPNRRIHSANSVVNTASHLEFLNGPHKFFEPNQQQSFRESTKSNQQALVPFQSGSSGAFAFRLLKLDHRNEPLSNSRVSESVSHLHLPKTSDTSNNHFMETDITPPKLLRTELPRNIGTSSAQQMKIDRMYKAKLLRMEHELRYLKSKSRHDLSKSLPDLSMTGEVAALKMTISQLESEQIDTLRLALHFRDRFKQVSKENADLATRFLKISEMAESAEQKLAMAETARIKDLEEIELLKSRFAEALRDQEIQQQENLSRALSQSDERLETIKATLILAEKKAADSSARALHAESKLEDAMKKLYNFEMENKRIRDEKNRLEEEKKISVVTANFTS